MHLPVAAQLLDHQGQPLFGRYHSQVPALDWQALAPPWQRSALWRYFHRKHWHYLALAHSDWFIALAIVDIGWANTAFAYIMDRRTGQLLLDYSRDGIPAYSASLSQQAEQGLACTFRFFSEHIKLVHDAASDCYVLDLRLAKVTLQAQIQRARCTPSLLAVAAVDGGSVHATQKTSAMPARATLRIDKQYLELDGLCASMDHSHGFLARDTEWRWASAHTHGLGFNLQAGYLGQHENALWLDDKIFPLSAAEFDYDVADPCKDWRIRTTDGLLELNFVVEGLRSENKNLLIAQSRYVQPVGRFYGWARGHAGAEAIRIDGIAGVTEDHFSRW